MTTTAAFPHVPLPDALTPGRRWATLEAAAEYVGGVNPRTVREWIAEGRIPGFKFGPRFIRVDLDDLDNMAERIPAAGSWGADA